VKVLALMLVFGLLENVQTFTFSGDTGVMFVGFNRPQSNKHFPEDAMRVSVTALSVAVLIALAGVLHAHGEYVSWLRGDPPDIDNLRAFEAGEISPLQQTLADGWLELAKVWAGNGQHQEAGDAIRRAQLMYQNHPEANELYDTLELLPESHRNIRLPEFSETYLVAVQRFQAQHVDEFIELATVFADRWLPISAEYCMQWAIAGAKGNRRLERDMDERLQPIRKRIGEHSIRLSSYNLLYPGGVCINQGDPEYWTWYKRRPLHDALVRHMQADIIGWQEISRWRPVLRQSWSEVYEFAGISGSDMIYYNKHRFEVLEEARSDPFFQNRRMPWARFRCRYSGVIINHFNVHLPFRRTVERRFPDSEKTFDEHQVGQVEICLECIEGISSPLVPTIYSGDFNTRGGSPWRMLVEDGPFCAESSYRDKIFGIDWVLCTKHLQLEFAGTVMIRRDNIRASDHHHVLVYLKRPDLDEARKTYEENPDSDEALLDFLRVYVLYDADAAMDFMAKAIADREPGERDELLRIQAEAELVFTTPQRAAEAYRTLARETNDEDLKHTATLRAFAILINRGLLDRRDHRDLQRYARDRRTPVEHRERAARLLERDEAIRRGGTPDNGDDDDDFS